MYIKALEQEVLRLKEVFSNTSRERDAYAEENRRLKELLMAHGIAFDLSSPANSGLQQMGSSTYAGSSRGSVSGGYGTGTNSTGYTSPSSQPVSTMSNPNQHGIPPQQAPPMQQQNAGLDYDQLGIDFVLTYDRTPYLSPPPQQ
jgi:hypothetical protein